MSLESTTELPTHVLPLPVPPCRLCPQVLLCVEGEARWCQAVLPDLHPRLLLAMLGALFEKIRKPFARRLAAAAEPQGAVQVGALRGCRMGPSCAGCQPSVYLGSYIYGCRRDHKNTANGHLPCLSELRFGRNHSGGIASVARKSSVRLIKRLSIAESAPALYFVLPIYQHHPAKSK